MKITSLFRCLLLLMAAAAFQSCRNILSEGSLDLVRHAFGGPSYTSSRPPSGDQLGFNLVAMVLLPSKADPPRVLAPNPGNLLASTREQLSFGSAYAPEPTSFFKSEKFALMPGVQLIRKGNRYSDSFGTDITHLLYLEALTYALYRHQLPDNKGELFGGLGPYLGYGLTGTFKYTNNGQTTKLPAFDTNNGGYKRLDAGVAFTVGYQLPSSLRIRLGYELGVLNIQPNPFGSDGDKTYNRALSLNVGYPLAKLVDKFKKQ